MPITKFLTAAGNGTGAYNLTGNYSAAPTDFYYQATGIYDVHTMIMVVSDNANFNQLDFGAISGGLTNGIKLFFKPLNQAEVPLLGGFTFKTNNDCLIITGHTIITSFAGLSQSLTVSFEIRDDFGIYLSMKPGDRFIVRLNDNLSSLVSLTFGLRGSLIL